MFNRKLFSEMIFSQMHLNSKQNLEYSFYSKKKVLDTKLLIFLNITKETSFQFFSSDTISQKLVL